LINEEGSIDPSVASNELERIGSWSHIQIPKYLALKSRGKEDGKPTVGKKMVNPGKSSSAYFVVAQSLNLFSHQVLLLPQKTLSSSMLQLFELQTLRPKSSSAPTVELENSSVHSGRRTRKVNLHHHQLYQSRICETRMKRRKREKLSSSTLPSLSSSERESAFYRRGSPATADTTRRRKDSG
jgi:hypothetical protein